MKSTWSELTERAAHNDQEAFSELYQNSYDAVYRTVKSMVKDDDAVLDIVQDAYIKGFGSLDTLDDPENFVPWMKRIATNKAKDHFKKRHDISFSQMADEEGNEPDFADESADNLPEAVIDRNETARLIEEILGSLSDEQRMAVGMYYYRSMSVAEIAEELGVSENTVKSRLNYARKKIKAGVEELEKLGTKLYGLSPIPFLIWLFRTQIENPAVGGAPAAVFENIVAGMSAASAAAASTASAAAASSTAASSSSAASTTASLASKAMTAIKLSSVGAKITAGVVAAAVIGGGTGAAVYMARRNAAASPAETSAASTEGDPGGFGEAEELLEAYLEGTLIPELGIYDACQPAYFGDSYGEIGKTSFAFDAESGTFSSGEVSVTPQDGAEYQAVEKEFWNAVNTVNLNGIYGADIDDYDGDGEPELFVVYGKDGVLYLSTVKHDTVFLTRKVSFDSILPEEIKTGIEHYEARDGTTPFSDIRHEYITRSIGKCRCEDGGTYIFISDEANRVDARTPRYVRLSGILEPLSCMTVDVTDPQNGVAVEFFYDGREPASYGAADYFSGGTDVPPDCMEPYTGEGVSEICRLFRFGAEPNDFIAKYYKGSENIPPTGIGERVPSEGLVFELNDGGASYAVSGIGSCTDSDIVIPDTYNGLPVTAVGDSAFKENNDLRSVVVPEGVTVIRESAFDSCRYLNNVTLPDSLETIGEYAFFCCYYLPTIDIPDSLTSIGENAFTHCFTLKEIRIPYGVTAIGKETFNLCSGLTRIDLPGSLTAIGDYAFQGCTSLREITVPASVTRIGEYAFENCTSLESVYLSYGLVSIGEEAFHNCSSLKKITIPDSVTDDGNFLFYGCTSLTEMVIPDSITSHIHGMFCDCTSLSKVTLPDTIGGIGNSTFWGCESLTEIDIPDSVTVLGRNAFASCKNLKHLTIPASVTSVVQDAFMDCPSLEDITFLGTMETWQSFAVWNDSQDYPSCVTHCSDGDLIK